MHFLDAQNDPNKKLSVVFRQKYQIEVNLCLKQAKQIAKGVRKKTCHNSFHFSYSIGILIIFFACFKHKLTYN